MGNLSDEDSSADDDKHSIQGWISTTSRERKRLPSQPLTSNQRSSADRSRISRNTPLSGTPLDPNLDGDSESENDELGVTPFKPPRRLPVLPRPSYYDDLKASASSNGSWNVGVEPKSRLLVSDLDNTLLGPSGDGIVARPYLRTFIQYITHPSSPYKFAIWTFSGRKWGETHLRQAGVGDLLFEDAEGDPFVKEPKLQSCLEVLWGFEDSGFLPSPPYKYGTMVSGPAVKDLQLMWELLNVQGHSDWSPLNSLIVDDQISNGRAQPDSIVVCPVFTSKSPDDDFLLAFIGFLDELAPSTNFASTIQDHRFAQGIALEEMDRYVERGKAVCRKLNVRVSRGTPYHDNTLVEQVKKTTSTPAHDAADEPIEPHPASFDFGRPVPKRVAKGMTLSPSIDYLAHVKETSQIGKVGKPLVVFDLDGTLYTRPPQNLEHDPNGQASTRPYLRTMLRWLLRLESPWSVAIWTGSQKTTAVRCLYELDLGIVGPRLMQDGEAEILHPKIEAVWAREDFGLTPEDYKSYVAVVKDLSKLWKYLNKIGAGDWNESNTVMVDDTPSKLRAQPSNLIAAPTYDYPLAPSSPSTRRSQLDTFLLSLVAQLEELSIETNFANYIEGKRWNVVMSEKEEKKYEETGVEILRKDGIPVQAMGRGILPGTIDSEYDQGRTTTRRIAENYRDSTPDARSANRLTLDALSKVPALNNPYHSDTSTGSNTSESVDGDAPDAVKRSRKMVPQNSRRR